MITHLGGNEQMPRDMIRHFNEIKDAEINYLERRDAGFCGVSIDILQNELDELRLKNRRS